jgi:branched-chain amino acid transport system ATP-binding protein
MRGDDFFRVEHLSKSFGGLQAVHDVSFHVEQGSITSLIGPNGAGKTTIFDLLTGFLTPSQGQVVFKHQGVIGRKPHEIVSLGMSRTFQHLGLFYQLSVWDNIYLGIPNKRRERLDGLFFPRRGGREEETALAEKTLGILEFLGLAEKRREQVANLSWGDQKLVSIGRLMATDNDLLLLDEPASGLTDLQITHLKGLLRDLVQQGKTVLLIDHNVDAVMDISDWIIVLNFGQILTAGTPQEILRNEEVIRVYLGKV